MWMAISPGQQLEVEAMTPLAEVATGLGSFPLRVPDQSVVATRRLACRPRIAW
jgi:hypothetical protein